MTSDFVVLTLAAAQLLLALAMAFAFCRLLRGPRAQDRVLALDTLYVNAMLLDPQLRHACGRAATSSRSRW